MSKRQIIYGDLTGGINNVETKEQLNSTPKKTESPDMVNVEYFGLGGIQTMEGNTQIGDKQSTPIVGGYEYTKGNKRYMMITTQDGYVKIYNDITNTYDEVFKFEHYSDKVSFCNVNDGIVVSNGIDDLLFYEHGRNTELQGVVSLDKDNNYILKGIQTKFGTDVKVGDYIRINNVEGKYKVESIDSDKLLTVDKPLEIKKGVEYYGFVGDEITRTLSCPDNLSVVNYDNTIDDNYNELKTEYEYTHNGNNFYNIYPSYASISGEIKQLDKEHSYRVGVSNITTTNYYILNGNLYNIKSSNNHILVDNSGTWTSLTSGEISNAYITYGIKNESLYLIYQYTDESGEDKYNTQLIGSGYVLLPKECGYKYAYICPAMNKNGSLYAIKTTYNESTETYSTTSTKIGKSTEWYKKNSTVNQISTWCGTETIVDTYNINIDKVQVTCIIISSSGKAYYFDGETTTIESTKSNNWVETSGAILSVHCPNDELFGPHWGDTTIYTCLLQKFENNKYSIYSLHPFMGGLHKIDDKDFSECNNKIYYSFQNVDIDDEYFGESRCGLCTLSTKQNDKIIIKTFKFNSFGGEPISIVCEKEIYVGNSANNICILTSRETTYNNGKLDYDLFTTELFYDYNENFNSLTYYVVRYDNYDNIIPPSEDEFYFDYNINIKSYPYFTKKIYNNEQQIGTSKYIKYDNKISFILDKLQVNGIPLIGDTITTEYIINNNNITKYTTDLVGASNVYSEANKESLVNNAEQISNYSDTNNINLSYTIPISDNTYYQFIGTNDISYNIINLNEELPTTELQYYLTDISELNAYLVNTDPDVASGENIHTPIRGTAIQYYNGRLWVGTDNGLFYSAVGLPNNWDIYSDAGVLYSIYNDSSKISALGLFSEYLTVHKQFSTYILTCSGSSDTIELKPFSNITCESQQGWIVSNTKYFVFSKDFLDIYPLIQHTVWSDKFLGVPISQNIRNLFKKVRIGDTDKIFCVGRPKERQMMFYLPIDGYVGSNIAVVYDFQTNSWLLRQVPQNVTSAWQYDNKIYIGTESGKVLEEFKGKTFDGEPINSYYKSPWFDWTGDYTQSFAEFIVEIDNTEDNNFYLDTQKDGLSRTEVRTIDSNKLYGESMLWAYDNDEENNDKMNWDNNNWLRATFETIRMLLPNNVFEDFQLRFFTDKIGQLFKIFKYGFRRIETEEAPW